MIQLSRRVVPLKTVSLIGKRYASGAIKYKYQDQLYLIPQDDSALISFSQKPSAVAIGRVINTGSQPLDSFKVDGSNFQENRDFLPKLHKLLNDVVHEDFVYKTEAGAAPNSHLPIYDFRGTPVYGRTPDVDNVLGYVRVDDKGEIIPHTYEENPMYRLSNDRDGLIKLSDALKEELLKRIE